MAIHSAIFEDEDDIQDMISLYSLDQFFISSTPRTRKRVEKAKKSIDSRIMVSRKFDFTQKSKCVFFVVKNIEFIEEKRGNRQMRRLTDRFCALLKHKNVGKK